MGRDGISFLFFLSSSSFPSRKKGRKNRKIGFERATQFFLARALLCRGRESNDREGGEEKKRREEEEEGRWRKSWMGKKNKGSQASFYNVTRSLIAFHLS